MKLLIVDDSVMSLTLLESILKNQGYNDIVTAKSGRQAIEILESSQRHTLGSDFDLILMDIIMPDMTGIETTKAIKENVRLRDIPVIMVSVKDTEDSLENAFAAGAIDYIHKPVSRIELLARVRSVLKLKSEMDKRKAREKELEELTQALALLSNLDGLTGVANRRRFDEILINEWRRAKRENTPLSILMIDIDHFKAFNDNYGHLFGDSCLKKVAQAIASGVRRPGDQVARYGGEEFAVILADTDRNGALTAASNIQSQIAQKAISHDKSPVSDIVTVSIGVATSTPKEEPASELVHLADQALYKAKKTGRNRIVQA